LISEGIIIKDIKMNVQATNIIYSVVIRFPGCIIKIFAQSKYLCNHEREEEEDEFYLT